VLERSERQEQMSPKKKVRATVVRLQNNIFMCSENTYMALHLSMLSSYGFHLFFKEEKKPSASVLAFDCN